jgi:hypothetical protein
LLLAAAERLLINTRRSAERHAALGQPNTMPGSCGTSMKKAVNGIDAIAISPT